MGIPTSSSNTINDSYTGAASLFVTAGAGGSGSSDLGGSGGDAEYNLGAGTLSFANGSLELTGGAGGHNANGALGGAAIVKAGKLAFTSTAANTMTIASGANGDTVANGGAAKLTVDTMVVNTGGNDFGATFTRAGGVLDVDIGTLEIRNGTNFQLGGAGKQAGDVTFGTLKLVSLTNDGGASWIGARFNAQANSQNFGADYTFKHLHVVGENNNLQWGATRYAPAIDSVLTFDLSGMQDGQTAVTTNGSLNLSAFNSANLKLIASSGSLDHLTAGTDSIILIGGLGVSNAPQYASAVAYTTTAADGGLTFYNFDVQLDNTDLVARYQDVATATAEGISYHSYLMAMDAQMISLNDGHNLVAGKVIDNAAAYAQFGRPWIGFDVQGSHYRNKVGSHVDVDTFSVALSLASKIRLCAADLAYGAFFEYGHGSYDTHHQLASVGSLRGDGDTDYYGGGLFARSVFDNGSWLEGSARLGGVKNDYKIRHNAGAAYDVTNAYYGLHLGLGHNFAVRRADTFGLYAKAFWNRVDSDDARAKSGERLRLDATDSFRTRLGAQYSACIAKNLKAYAGAAWEYEFDGEASGRVNRIRTRKSELKGSSAFMEAGVSYQPRDNISIDAGVFGMLGQQKGIGGNVGVSFAF